MRRYMDVDGLIGFRYTLSLTGRKRHSTDHEKKWSFVKMIWRQISEYILYLKVWRKSCLRKTNFHTYEVRSGKTLTSPVADLAVSHSTTIERLL